MRIVLLVEGRTESVCKPVLKALLDEVADARGKPHIGLATRQYNGSGILDAEAVAADAAAHLEQPDTAGVAVLVDVFPEFPSADAATEHYCARLRDDRFRAHCALHDFEAWLLPHWKRVYRLAGKTAPKQCPWSSPERVDLMKPPARVLSELLAPKHGYEKTRDVQRILRSPDDLRLSAEKCPQLKAFLNTLLEFAGYDTRL
jgi:hypothetical protein